MTTSKAPSISVVMSVYNAEAYVDQAIRSVVGQSFPDFEFIIIDDGSTDSSTQTLERWRQADPRIRLETQPNQGLTAALNCGLAFARGRYVARMDADDICASERLGLQYEWMEGHPECVALGTQVLLIDPEGLPICVMERPLTHDGIESIHLSGVGGGIVHPSAMIRRDAIDAIGGYRERWAVAQDLDLWLRLAERGELKNLDSVLLEYRLHLSSTATTKRQQQASAAREIVRDACCRRGIPQQENESRIEPVTTAMLLQKWLWRAISAGNLYTARALAWRLFCHRPFSRAGAGAFVRWATLCGKNGNSTAEVYNSFPKLKG
jgi:glycosyltransferase involved in cell wall biosynthesis